MQYSKTRKRYGWFFLLAGFGCLTLVTWSQTGGPCQGAARASRHTREISAALAEQARSVRDHGVQRVREGAPSGRDAPMPSRRGAAGYPAGLRENSIPVAARIIAVAAAYDRFVSPCGFDIPRTLAEMVWLRERDEWQQLSAVQSGRVFIADGNQYFNRPGPRLVESLEILAEILHPDLFHFGHEGKGWERL